MIDVRRRLDDQEVVSLLWGHEDDGKKYSVWYDYKTDCIWLCLPEWENDTKPSIYIGEL